MLPRASSGGGFAGVAVPVHPDGGVVASDARGALAERAGRDRRSWRWWPCPPPRCWAWCARRRAVGVRALLVVSAGFADSDEPEGRERERGRARRRPRPRAAAGRAERAGRGQHRSRASSLHALMRPRRRGRRVGLALSSQSGALGLALLGHAAARGLGISSFVALGNRADVSTNDLLEHWADDERTAVVALYMESFGNPRRFSQVARRVSRRKPILAVKGGRGRLLDDAATDALFRQAGVPARRDDADAVRRRRAARAPAAAGRAPGRRGDELGRPRRGGRRRARRARPRAGGARRADARAAGGGAARRRSPRQPDRPWRARAGGRRPRGHRRSARRRARGRRARPARRARLPATRRSACRRSKRPTRDAAKPVLACVVGAGGELPRRARWRVPNYRFPEAAVRALGLAADRRDWLSRPLGQAPVVERLDLEAARAVAAAAGEGALEDGRGARAAERRRHRARRGRRRAHGRRSRSRPVDRRRSAVAPRAAHRRRCRRARPRRPGAARRRRAPGRPRGRRPGLAAVELDPLAVTSARAPQRQRAKTW